MTFGFRLLVKPFRLVPVIVVVLQGVCGQQQLACTEMPLKCHLGHSKMPVIAHDFEHFFACIHCINQSRINVPLKKSSHVFGVFIVSAFFNNMMVFHFFFLGLPLNDITFIFDLLCPSELYVAAF
jgi:hypothetical protein